ncbi:MAG: YitT family protein [SAR324 cluster bacterium]|nr:YitT family protein [SAR324 cluster bacterium]
MSQNRFIEEFRWQLRELFQAFTEFRLYRTLAAMAVGIALIGVAINGIVIPQNMIAPGVSGISLLIFYVAHKPALGLIYFALNVPLFVIGWRVFALKYLFISICGVVMLSASLELTRDVRIPVPDPLMGSIIAAVILGFGSGFYLRLGGSAGGLDILATVIRKKFALPMGRVFVAVNAINLAGAWLVYDLNSVLYSALFMWVQAWTLDRVQTGFSQRRSVLIISDRPEEVAEGVMKRLDRGVTFFHGADAHSADPKKIVYTVINMVELGRLKELLFNIDPDALVVVHHTAEVIGARFLTWEEEGYHHRPPRPPAH